MEPPHQPDLRPLNVLLESTHTFPGIYKIKAIGNASGDFESRVISAVHTHLAAESDLDYSVRATPGGRHIAVTLEVTVQTAVQILAIYAEIRSVEGLTLLL